MTEHELRQVLDWLDSALEVYHSHAGKMSVSEVRAGSMLLVVRESVADELRRQSISIPRARPLRKEPSRD